MKKTATKFMLLGSLPLAALSFTACNGVTSPASEANRSETDRSSDSNVSQMDHGSMANPGSSGAMPPEHSAMMNMDLGPADEAFDLRFIDGMIPHHEGALLMAQEMLQKSNRAEIKQLAQAIIAAQEQEISQLQEWRQEWYPDAGDLPVMYSAEMGHTMPMTKEMRSSMMMQGNLGEADDQFDLRFIEAMIPHHEGAVDMAQQALEKSDRTEIQTLAQSIIDSQQQEIDQMMQWRQEWYGK